MQRHGYSEPISGYIRITISVTLQRHGYSELLILISHEVASRSVMETWLMFLLQSFTLHSDENLEVEISVVIGIVNCFTVNRHTNSEGTF